VAIFANNRMDPSLWAWKGEDILGVNTEIDLGPCYNSYKKRSNDIF